MSLCVPEWDGSGGMLGSGGAAHGVHGAVSGKAEFVSSRRSHYLEVPDQDWSENEMQGHGSKGGRAQWQYAAGWSEEDAVTPSKPKDEVAALEGVAPVAPVAPVIDNVEDEMVSWLQYPLDASLEQSYCSEFFVEPPAANSQLLLREAFGHGAARAVRSSYPGSEGASLDRVAIADAAMTMGAGRAAGILPQIGVEAFSKVRTVQPATKWPSSSPSSNISAPSSNPMLPPKPHSIAPLPPVGSMNFSHFSRPAAVFKANLHSLATGSLPAPPLKPSRITEASTSSGSCIAESTTAEVNVHLGVTDHGSGGDQETCRQSGVTSDAVLASSEKAASLVTQQQPDVQEPTVTSSSGGYGTSAERLKEAGTSIKRKSSERDDAECQSEDGEGESKKPVTGRGSTTKRSRAAEVHNQSERRRRDRINEKMKALQELIPNSNKTDKASMLDEAIEYLKMLQQQLHIMSIKTGLSLPPMVVPPGLQQHMQVPHVVSMGMGMGMLPMGLGMGMMDMGVSGPGRAVMSGNMAGPSTVVDMHDLRYQVPSGVPMESYNAYMARQHQPMQMNQPMDKYNAYLFQQRQLQQHRIHQHQQQHHIPQHQLPQHQLHQQHQIHQQAPTMNGGPPH